MASGSPQLHQCHTSATAQEQIKTCTMPHLISTQISKHALNIAVVTRAGNRVHGALEGLKACRIGRLPGAYARTSLGRLLLLQDRETMLSKAGHEHPCAGCMPCQRGQCLARSTHDLLKTYTSWSGFASTGYKAISTRLQMEKVAYWKNS